MQVTCYDRATGEEVPAEYVQLFCHRRPTYTDLTLSPLRSRREVDPSFWVASAELLQRDGATPASFVSLGANGLPKGALVPASTSVSSRGSASSTSATPASPRSAASTPKAESDTKDTVTSPPARSHESTAPSSPASTSRKRRRSLDSDQDSIRLSRAPSLDHDGVWRPQLEQGGGFAFDTDDDDDDDLVQPDKAPNLVGALHQPVTRLRDESGKAGLYTIFHDLSVRAEGDYRLQMRCFSLEMGGAGSLATAVTDPFHSFSAKRFPGMCDPTSLSRCFAKQGVRIPVRGGGSGDKA